MTHEGRTDIREQLAELTAQVAALQDQQAIYQLIASYGPAVDSLSGELLAGMWAPDGVYDAGGSEPFVGREAVVNLIDSDMHREFHQAGCAHVLSLPIIRLAGDRATAVNHSRVYVHSGSEWRLARVSSNHWTLRKCGGRWEVELRTNRLLNGDPGAAALLAHEEENADA